MFVAQLLPSVAVLAFFIYMPKVTAWTLHSDPQTVDLANTVKVEISCLKGDAESPSQFDYVHSLYITKFNSDGVPQILASMNFDTVTATTKDVNFTAYASNDGLRINSTHITHALGRYGCVITGLGKLGQVVQVTLSPLSITKEVTVADVLASLQQKDRELRAYVDSRLRDVSRSLRSDLESNLTLIHNAVDDINMTLETILEKTGLTQKPTSPIQKPSETPKRSWPKGEFALYDPNSGCPSTPPSAWKREWLQFKTVNRSASRNNASIGNHFRSPLFTRKNGDDIAYWSFCVHSDTASSFSWPNGTYCIAKHWACPEGFNEGDIALYLNFKRDEYDSSSGAKNVLSVYDGYISSYYCCRKDANPTSPISLPMDKPFYLYRFGGTCQQVRGMTVREEFMTIDTTVTGYGQDYFYHLDHPDATLNPVTLHFCYYFVTNT